MKGAKHEKQEEALTMWIGELMLKMTHQQMQLLR
jgi:hypothetical protein